MSLLSELIRHNAWANRQVFASFQSASAVLDTVCYDGAPLRSRLQHQVATERAFLDVLRGDPKRPQPPSELSELLDYDAENAGGLIAAADAAGDAAAQERPHFVPWWNAELPFHVLVSQVITHSGQHRSELAWELARAGVNTGEIDYIRWVAGGRPRPGEPAVIPGG